MMRAALGGPRPMLPSAGRQGPGRWSIPLPLHPHPTAWSSLQAVSQQHQLLRAAWKANDKRGRCEGSPHTHKGVVATGCYTT